MIHRNPFRFFYVIFMAWLLSACQLSGNDSNSDTAQVDKRSGSLELSIGTLIRNKTLEPNVSLDVAQYQITGLGPDGTSFSTELTGSNTIAVDFLRFGNWNIMVEALNDTGYIFARGSSTAMINVGETTDINIVLSMLEGPGSLDLSIQWSTEEVQSPVLSGFLRSDGAADIPVVFQGGAPALTDETRTALLDGNVPAGYYTLIVTLFDQGADGNQTHLAMGIAETVRILEGQTTTGAYVMDGVPGLGSVGLNLNVDSDDPILLSFIDAENYPLTFDLNGNTQFTAGVTVDENDEDAGNISYVWFMNGELLAIDNSYTFNSLTSPQSSTVNGRYLPGHYRIDVVAQNVDGSRAGSNTFSFEVTGNPTEIPLPVTFGAVAGQVGMMESIDGDAQFVPLLGAQILVGGRSAATDLSGNFSVDFVADGEQVVQVVLDGYFSTFKPVTVFDQALTNTDTIILRASETFSIDASTGGSISLGSGQAGVTFGANVIVDENGNAYSGTMSVNATAVNPLNNDFFEAFPGDFEGLTEGGDVVDIISFGAIAVELKDANGNDLAIADGESAEIRIPVEDPVNAPPTLALWYLDENTGMWTEEGIATLIGNEYVGSVTHFSWWNFDYRPAGFNDGFYARTNISGTVVDNNGSPIADAQVILSSVAGLNWATTVQSDASGNFAATVYVARNQPSPYYAAYASKDALRSVQVPIRLIENQNVSGVQITLDEPEIRMSLEARLNGVVQGLINDGPLLRFGESDTSAQIEISNEVINGLSIASISINNTTNTAFNLINNNVDLINPLTNERRGNLNRGASLTFLVQYIRPNDGSQSFADITINSNDAKNPSITIRLEAGTDRSAPVSQSTTIDHAETHSGYVLRDNAGALTAINTSTDQFVPIFEGTPDAYRVMFGFDVSFLPDTLLNITAARLILNTADHNGLNLYQGQQGANLATSDFEPLDLTALTDVVIPAGAVTVDLNAAGVQKIFDVIQQNSADKVMPFLLMNTDATIGTVNLMSMQLELEFEL